MRRISVGEGIVIAAASAEVYAFTYSITAESFRRLGISPGFVELSYSDLVQGGLLLFLVSSLAFLFYLTGKYFSDGTAQSESVLGWQALLVLAIGWDLLSDSAKLAFIPWLVFVLWIIWNARQVKRRQSNLFQMKHTLFGVQVSIDQILVVVFVIMAVHLAAPQWIATKRLSRRHFPAYLVKQSALDSLSGKTVVLVSKTSRYFIFKRVVVDTCGLGSELFLLPNDDLKPLVLDWVRLSCGFYYRYDGESLRMY